MPQHDRHCLLRCLEFVQLFDLLMLVMVEVDMLRGLLLACIVEEFWGLEGLT